MILGRWRKREKAEKYTFVTWKKLIFPVHSGENTTQKDKNKLYNSVESEFMIFWRATGETLHTSSHLLAKYLLAHTFWFFSFFFGFQLIFSTQLIISFHMCDISEAWAGPAAHVGLVDGGIGGQHLPALIPRPMEQIFSAKPRLNIQFKDFSSSRI